MGGRKRGTEGGGEKKRENERERGERQRVKGHVCGGGGGGGRRHGLMERQSWTQRQRHIREITETCLKGDDVVRNQAEETVQALLYLCGACTQGVPVKNNNTEAWHVYTACPCQKQQH